MLELPVAPVRASPVKILMLYLTLECNLACDYCFQARQPRRMSAEVARRSIDFLLERRTSGSASSVAVNFFGGEPFLCPDRIEEVITYARKPRANCYKRVEFSATTNGTLASSRVERLIKDGRMSLLVSLDGGPEAMKSRPFRGGSSAYQVVAGNLPKLLSWSENVIGRLTYRPSNLRHLKENLQHLAELGFREVAMAPVQEESWNGWQVALEEEHLRLADWLVQEARADRVAPLSTTWEMLRNYHYYLLKKSSPGGCTGCRPGRPCQVGNGLLSIDPEGNVMPCHQFLYRPESWLGTVEQPDLGEKRQPYLRLSSRDILGCAGCLAEPVCGGGCRATAIQYGLGLDGAHPGHCLVTRAHARAVIHAHEVLAREENPVFYRQMSGHIQTGLSELALQN